MTNENLQKAVRTSCNFPPYFGTLRVTEFYLALALELALSAITGLCLLGVAPVLRRLFRSTSINEVTPEWVESFSVDRYLPMAGLLGDEDFDFLASQPGFDSSIYKKLRRERLSIFEQYLNRLILDFKKLHCTARYVVARSEVDQSDAALKLMRLQWVFAFSVLQVQVQYQLCRLGIGTVRAKVLIAQLQQMCDHLSAVSLPQTA
jgi:hypothetical protein